MTIEKVLPSEDLPARGTQFDNVEVEPVLEQEGDITFGEDELPMELPFDGNLVEALDEGQLTELGTKLVNLFDGDDKSREDWKKTYMKGLDLLGLKYSERTTPWAGACGVWHPVLIEAVVRFQAQAIMEIFPASGPVKTKIVGKFTIDKEKQAQRVQQELNYFIQDKMTEYRSETERLLFYLALAGSAFRKIYYDETLKRPVGTFIPAEDFVVPYGTTDLKTCPRYTQIMRMFPNDVRKLQAVGFYADIELPEPVRTQTELSKKYDTIQGQKPAATYETQDERYMLLEMHVDLDLPGFEDENGIERPYIVTLDHDSQKILAIRRNWEETDPMKQRKLHFVPYHYLPGLGFYGSGLIHLIGGIAQSATSILRQLVDAGTLANLPGGLKTRGLRIKGDDSPIMPGEFRDVDVPMGSIKDNITFLPYKEPSTVLFQLLQSMVEQGQKLGAAPDLPVNSMTSEAPVGTTLALMERSMKVMSAVQARLHASLKTDFRLIADCIREYMPGDYDYEVEGKEQGVNRQRDFADSVDIIPVSDPNASSMAQRVVQYQAALELAKLAPQLYDLPELNRQMLTILGLPNVGKLVKDDQNMMPMDPVSENQAILTGKPVKAWLWQDQDAHIAVHLAAIQDPKMSQMVGQSPQANLIIGSAVAHITEHLAYKYRKEIEKQMGVPLPPEGPLPPEVEVQLSKMVAEAANRLLQKDKAEAAQQQAQQQMQDPVFQLQMREVAVKEKQVEQKGQEAQQRFALDRAKLLVTATQNEQKLASQERVAGAALGVKIAQDRADRHAEGKDNTLAHHDQLLQAAAELADLEFRHRELAENSRQHTEKMETQRQATQAKAATAAKKPNGAANP